jgi:hypothetical protein
MHSKASLLFLILTATFRSAEVRKDWVHSSCLILWRRCKSYLLGTRAYLLASRCPQRSTAMALSIQRRRLRKYAMRYVLAKSTRHLMWRIRTLALMVGVVLVFGSPPVFARGGAHSGGHGGGHSGGHGGHSGGQRGHHGGHVGNTHGRITTGTTTRGHFTHQNPCPLLIRFGRIAPTRREAVADDSSPKGREQVRVQV